MRKHAREDIAVIVLERELKWWIHTSFAIGIRREVEGEDCPSEYPLQSILILD